MWDQGDSCGYLPATLRVGHWSRSCRPAARWGWQWQGGCSVRVGIDVPICFHLRCLRAAPRTRVRYVARAAWTRSGVALSVENVYNILTRWWTLPAWSVQGQGHRKTDQGREGAAWQGWQGAQSWQLEGWLGTVPGTGEAAFFRPHWRQMGDWRGLKCFWWIGVLVA